MLQTFSQYWAGPLCNILLVTLVILLLYPILWKLTFTQLSALTDAISTAKSLPDTAAKLEAAADQLRQANQELRILDDKLRNLDIIVQKLEEVNRNVADIQTSAESQVPITVEAMNNAADTSSVNSEADNWDAISEIWKKVKAEIEMRIEKLDGRTRRKYPAMSRYNFGHVGGVLRRDGGITDEQETALRNMDELFRSIKNRRTVVSSGMRENFEEWSKIVLSQ